MDSFMAWVGGKKALRDDILNRFPLSYDRYIEVFGGGGWVLFNKPPKNDFEVYNDFNNLLVNLYRQVRSNPVELKRKLRYVLNSRSDFNLIKKALSSDKNLSDIDKASIFYQLIRYSYASGLKSFGGRPSSMWRKFPLIDNASERLQNVVIENKDFEALIKHYDRETSFFYCDPPYFETEKYYDNIGNGFLKKDHIRLRDTLLNIKGKFMVSYNECDFIKNIYTHPKIHIQKISRLNNLKLRYESGSEYAEYLIANYDMDELSKQNQQLNLFN